MRGSAAALALGVLGPAVLVAACETGGGSGVWLGTVDTLASGEVVVHNPAEPIWGPDEGWQVVEETRIGQVSGEGPDLFGAVFSFAVDGAGRFWALDGQTQDIRVFDGNGTYVRTVGRQGGGPGEFAQAVKVETGPHGDIWVMDPGNNRLSVFDTAGVYLEGRPALGGFVIFPWPGRFDARGDYFAPVPLMDEDFRVGMVRYDSTMTVVDTISPPEDPVDRERFEHRGSGGGVMMASIPYQGSFQWRISNAGTIWAILTGEYRLFELSLDGDTLRSFTRAFDPLPVTSADLDRARENLEWFVSQGGSIDLSKVPDTKPPVSGFFQDDEGNVWVEVTTASEEDDGHVFDIFDPLGRYLGPVHLPFPLATRPLPIFRNGQLYGAFQDELEVTYLVRARVEKGPNSAGASGMD
jgi:hypothetical protein